MMSDDLDWTQTLGDALTYQQKDVLIAIQQLRDKAVAAGVIKTDDKITVDRGERQRRHPVGQPRDGLCPAIRAGDALRAGLRRSRRSATIPNPIRTTTYPTAHVLRRRRDRRDLGRGRRLGRLGRLGRPLGGGDIDIDCNNCFNNVDFNGKVNFNDVDWKNVDRSQDQFRQEPVQQDRPERDARTASRRTTATACATRPPRSGRNARTRCPTGRAR